ncbi:hypothetical protein FIBSPDRAFT_848326 [Athelia psychrophila]|uniref:Uncharacterized protein n=1 Tax=Athelia psychrophila TaxID=1759441 RepID=A0A166V9Y1_9AGAM|nr:hypothetical protein FIBSPDRAFT_848326 [Fibularhizoctonia sp. CBS 109695]
MNALIFSSVTFAFHSRKYVTNTCSSPAHLVFSWPVSNVSALYSRTTQHNHNTSQAAIAPWHGSSPEGTARNVPRALHRPPRRTSDRDMHHPHPGRPKLPMLLLRLPPARKHVLIELILNLAGGVTHKDARVWVARTYLRLRALQRGLRVLELGSDVVREAEVWVLVDRAGDETRDGRRAAEDVREGVREGGRGLDGGEHSADVVPVIAGEVKSVPATPPEQLGMHESVKPNVDLTWLYETCREIRDMLR